ncbi:DUF6426 family protein [Kitasatospora sp. NPDC002227]|uniref:DUF6426 family protein n=1 Tax=Kitasatospora sp. NPDC002227 TaxID=3154773 RepID=UPI00333060D7
MRLRTTLAALGTAAALLAGTAAFSTPAFADCENIETDCPGSHYIPLDDNGFENISEGPVGGHQFPEAPEVVISHPPLDMPPVDMSVFDPLHWRASLPPNWNIVPAGGSYKMTVVSKVWVRQNCEYNGTTHSETINQKVDYEVQNTTQGNVDLSVLKILSGSIGKTFNTKITRSTTVNATVYPGEGWAVNVEYQNVVYVVKVPRADGSTLDVPVVVQEPTNTVATTRC